MPRRLARHFGGGGWIRTFEAIATDLQSAPFGHSGTPPYEIGAGGRTRTPDLLITNQLLYQLSYTSMCTLNANVTISYFALAVKYQITIFFTKLRIIERGATRKKLHIEGPDRKVIFSARAA